MSESRGCLLCEPGDKFGDCLRACQAHAWFRPERQKLGAIL
jgi:hypothetical protein